MHAVLCLPLASPVPRLFFVFGICSLLCSPTDHRAVSVRSARPVITMNSRFVLFFVTLLALALFVAANPLPANDAVLVKKALKQYDARAAQAKKRDEEHPKPSK